MPRHNHEAAFDTEAVVIPRCSRSCRVCTVTVNVRRLSTRTPSVPQQNNASENHLQSHFPNFLVLGT